MIDNDLKIEDETNSLLKKLGIIIDNLSCHLSKDKMEKALIDGYNFINEIEINIKRINEANDGKANDYNLLIIKGDLKQKKEKFEQIQKDYISNKSNELIDTFDQVNESEEEETKDNIIEENTEIYKESDKKDEFFDIVKETNKLSDEYLNNDNIIFIIKHKLKKFCENLKIIYKETQDKTKYLFAIILFSICLIFCILNLVKLISEK